MKQTPKQRRRSAQRIKVRSFWLKQKLHKQYKDKNEKP